MINNTNCWQTIADHQEVKIYAENDYRLIGTNPVCGCDSHDSGNSPSTSFNPAKGIGICHKCGRGFSLYEYSKAAGLTVKSTNLPSLLADIFNRSDPNSPLIAEYFNTRALPLITNRDAVKDMFRLHTHSMNCYIIYAICNVHGDIVKIGRIEVDANGNKIDKTILGKYTGDRASVINPGKPNLYIFEEIEDGLTWLQMTGFKDTVIVTNSAAGFNKIGTFLYGYETVTVILDPDDASINASRIFGSSVKRLTPSMKCDANQASMDGRFEEWFQTLQEIPCSNGKIEFWIIDALGGIIFKLPSFIEYLFQAGFSRFKMGASYIYIKDMDGILYQQERHQVKDYIFHEAEDIPLEVIEYLYNYSNLFGDWMLNFIAYTKRTILRDEKDCSYIPFKNGIMRITKDEARLIPYSELARDKGIWHDHIIQHDYVRNDSESIFEMFLKNVSSYVLDDLEVKKEAEAYGEKHIGCSGRFIRESDFLAKKSVMGYLIHTYKNIANAKAIVCIDAEISETAEGGTGKSLFSLGFKQIRNLIKKDGKSIDFSNRFVFQNIPPDAQIICLDDVSTDFQCEGLYNAITGDLEIEQKYMKRLILPFAESPKIIITTNHVIQGEGNSYDRRLFIIEFSDFYKYKNPVEIHGGLFYIEWDEDEWNKFYTYIIHCVQLFLRDGLKEPKILNYNEKKMLTETSDTFIAWADQIIECGVCYTRDELLSSYQSVTKIDITQYSKNKFASDLKRWCKARNYIYNPTTGGQRYTSGGVTYVIVARKKPLEGFPIIEGELFQG